MLRQQRLAVAAACGKEWGQKGQNLDAVFLIAAEERQEIDPAVEATAQVATMWANAVISSSGLATLMTTQSGAYRATFSATCRMMAAFVSIRSMRLIPGLRGNPAVMTTIDESAMAS